MSVFAAVAVFLFGFFAFPALARAWGPGVHTVTGNWVLQNIGTLGLPMGALLLQHPRQFLHGLLSADIFIGKGSRATEGHSHNWESGFQLLERAKRDDEKAFAYGYLSHLAEDIVAHNVFVPGLLHTLPSAGRLAHVYLEAQADRLLTWESGQLLGLFKGGQSRGASDMLSKALQQKAFSFWMKKQLFQGSIFLGSSRLWRSSMKLVDTLIPERERGILLEGMLTLSTMAMVDFLRNGKDSRLLTLDPIGESALNGAGEGKGKAAGLFPVLPWSAVKPAEMPEMKVIMPPELENLAPDIRPEWGLLKK